MSDKSCLPAQAHPLLLVALVAFAALPVSANETNTKPAARPVARLVSTSRDEVASRPRPRVIANYRAVPAATTSPRPAATSAASPTRSESRLLDLINEERRAHGRRPLAWDGALTRMARHHSENMSRQGFFSHVDRDGLSMTGRAELLGVHGWKALAENLAYNQGYDDPESYAVEGWMHSEKHRANILKGEFTHAGLGVARGADGRIYFTQVFMER
ncbi:MAG TPA: CAP domain-containing protein [Pyrinomonadaceae bacterium]